MIDLNSTKTKRHLASDEITKRIDSVITPAQRLRVLEGLARLPLPPEDDYWGKSISASAVGDECARRIQLSVWPSFHPQHIPKRAPLDEKSRRVFARGHATEELMQGWLQEAGFQVSYATEEGRQHGFVTANGQIKGFADGVFVSSQEPTLTLWEHKTLGNTGFRKAWNHGIVKAHPKYDAQAQLLMAYMNADATLFTILNADTGDLYAEAVPFDATRAQAASDRAVHVLQATRAGDLLPKAGADGDSFPCKWCRFVAECWGE